MEIEGADGSKLALKTGSKTILGRGSGFSTSDRTVSRRHVELELQTPVEKNGKACKESRVSFEVTGKNPVWVRIKANEEVQVFKNSDKGQLENGDWLCVSGRIPVWFALKKTEDNGKEEERDLGNDSGAESVGIEDIDPVKEFGFLVIGHEFDQYPNQRIRSIQNWAWFLEEHGKGKDSDDDEDDDVEAVQGRRGSKGRKRKKGDSDDDDNWTGESEEATAKGGKVGRAVYSTRSKDGDKSKKAGVKLRSNGPKKSVAAGEESGVDDDDDDDDDNGDDDETLGGFIVEDDDAELEEGSEPDEEEEEDFDDEDEDNGD